MVLDGPLIVVLIVLLIVLLIVDHILAFFKEIFGFSTNCLTNCSTNCPTNCSTNCRLSFGVFQVKRCFLSISSVGFVSNLLACTEHSEIKWKFFKEQFLNKIPH